MVLETSIGSQAYPEIVGVNSPSRKLTHLIQGRSSSLQLMGEMGIFSLFIAHQALTDKQEVFPPQSCKPATLDVEYPTNGGVSMASRRTFLRKSGQLCAGALAAGAVSTSVAGAAATTQTPSKKLRIMMKSAWGSDDPTRASFVFGHAVILAEAGHDVQIFLLGEATYLMRKETLDQVKPVGWPPLSETMAKVVAHKIPVFA